MVTGVVTGVVTGDPTRRAQDETAWAWGSGAEHARQLFSGRRLRLARELRGVAQGELAELLRLTPGAVSQFEGDDARPSAETLRDMCEAMKLPLGFFASKVHDTDLTRTAFFRSLRSTPASDRKRARAQAFVLHWLALAVERHVQLPELSVPRLVLPEDPDEDLVEAAANEVRHAWGLPRGPIPHVVRTLERHGIVAARLHVGSATVDAFSIDFPERPIVILGADKRDRERSRFDAAHELGHLVIHEHTQAGDKIVEKQAHQFAAAFLMPRDDIVGELPNDIDLRRLYALKGRWGVSMAALLMRARTLRVMEPSTYVRAMKMMSARGWRKHEPGELGPAESPALLGRAVEIAAASGISVEQLAHDAGVPAPEIEALLGASADPRPNVHV